MTKIAAIDFLASSKRPEIPFLCVLCGDDLFLMRESFLMIRNAVLTGDDAEFSLSEYGGNTATFADVSKDVATLAMFGGGRRLVRIEKADPFLTAYRSNLEKFASTSLNSGVLLLELQTFPATTIFYKKVMEHGLIIDCKALVGKAVSSWLTQWSASRMGVKLDTTCASMIVELIGDDLGLLDQEVRRLSLLVPPKEKITPALIKQHVGSWRTNRVWDMIDNALNGDVPGTITQLQQLLLAGENPVGILLMLAPTLRRLATATELFLEAERKGLRPHLGTLLQEAGVPSFFIKKNEPFMIKLGRHRGDQLSHWLLEADLTMKGADLVMQRASRAEPRLILETLLVRLSSPALKNS